MSALFARGRFGRGAALAAAGAAAWAVAARAETALQALSHLPPDHVAALVKVVGKEGALEPERWRFLSYDPLHPSGVRESVVSGSAVVAARGLSQFAERLGAAEVLGVAAMLRVKIDSTAAGETAVRYAEANEVALGWIDYELARSEIAAAPVWRVTGRDGSGNRVGELRIAADTGEVVGREGFPKDPGPAGETALSGTGEPGSELSGTGAATPKPKPRPKKRSSGGKKKEDENVAERVGNSIKKFFRGLGDGDREKGR